MLARWWSKKYNLPANDERLLRASQRDLLIEFFADQEEKREEVRELLREAGNSDPMYRDRLEKALSSLNRLLDGAGEGARTGDVTVDRWDEMLDRGEDPEDLFELSPELEERLKRRQRQRGDIVESADSAESAESGGAGR